MQAMKSYRLRGPAVFLMTALMLALPVSIFSYTSAELSKYNEMELIAPDFSLQGLDGETYTLSDLRGKVVVIEAGSST